jgi:hypothetical protein
MDADSENRADSLPWLPSQAYYAIHAALDAVLETHGLATESHTGALNSFAATICKKLPFFPLAITCEGYENAWKFTGFPVTPMPCNATRVGDDEQTWCNHLATALKTTRCEDAEDEVAVWKRKQKKKRIPSFNRDRIVERRKPTTLLHLLWRLRRRSNYGDIDLFLVEPHRRADLDFMAAAYAWIVKCYIAAFEALVERKIGTKALEAMMHRFPDDDGPPEFLRRRWNLKT